MSKRKSKKSNSNANSPTNSPKVNPINNNPENQIIEQVIPTLLVENPDKWKNWWIRGFWTIIMMCGFLCFLLAGPQFVILLVAIIQVLVYREVIAIGIGPSKDRKLPWFRSLHWHFLLSTNYFLYGESLIYYYKPFVLVDAFLMPLATHHRFISFSLYCLGLVVFVLGLKKGHYKFQFAHFCWTHMALLLVVVQSQFIINNIFEGLIWFVLPSFLVICNDIFAYIFGFFFGKTPLIRISPKKTWEGFMGGLFATTLFGFFFAGFLASFPYMVCSLNEMGTPCVPNPIFLPHTYKFLPSITAALRWISLPLHTLLPSYIPIDPIRTFTLRPIQFHALIFALFASLIAPFGGFFASGVKRAFKIKDFSDSIPGHGGLTDRMDCQFIMGVFTSLYFQSFVSNSSMNVGTVLEVALTNLDAVQLSQLYEGLGQYLEGQGLLP
ncbi:cytidylyltransferase family-domain-containing protein [Globomyces pollinis-pini]|nr:cytidylyltransferase family-domain-containing protein [Globomyces pollinis-pini]